MKSNRQKPIIKQEADVPWVILLAFAVSVIITLAGVNHVFQIWRVYHFGGRADGAITANRIATNYPLMYHLQIEFRDQYGRLHTFEDGLLRKERAPVGSNIAVIYDQREPRKARLASERLYHPDDFWQLLFGGFCWLFLYWDIKARLEKNGTP